MSWVLLPLCCVDLFNLSIRCRTDLFLRPIYWYCRLCSGIYALIPSHIWFGNGNNFWSVQYFYEKDLLSVKIHWVFTFCKSWLQLKFLVTSWSIPVLIHTDFLTFVHESQFSSWGTFVLAEICGNLRRCVKERSFGCTTYVLENFSFCLVS